ncbi:amino acid permease [Limosilactobacillus sp. WF-MT5-A]|uniref:APC family permease n=1 Tax=Limosilactobacillus agrestis TaxID=2759748 RepID=UPI0015F9E234|nr:amino acid permease [Limosilactobacillus agrestis]MBB1099359.1 amino acid permease [Limosilactobacillus agrestis]MCD7119845.1 amino acid permease [Limosilactobacillus agrestis]MCD7126573.1 amino acid permease [Limosilactobacillus agrestis]
MQNQLPKGKEHEKTLGLFDLSILGIGAIIGTGILVLTGIVAAEDSGPAIVFSFLIAALASGLIGLCYSELTTSLPNSGSAFYYAWVSIGKFMAFLAGWTLIGVYVTTTATVANGWTGYVQSFLEVLGVKLPQKLLVTPAAGGYVNLPAVLMILFMTIILTRGTSESKLVNNFLVGVKIFIIILFIVVSVQHINPVNWHPFLPYGYKGIFTGASAVFFSFLGFDALATSAEDAKDVDKNIPRAIILCLVISTALYILVSLVMTGVLSYKDLNVSEAMSYVLLAKGHKYVAEIVSLGAVLGIMAVVFAFIYAGSNIMKSMSRSAFLPQGLAKVNTKTQSPNHAIWLVGLLAAILAGEFDLHYLALIANIGSLVVFALISLIVIILRYRYPELKRPFKVPFGNVIPILSVLICIILLVSISLNAWLTYLLWLVIGLGVYFCYSLRHANEFNFQDDSDIPGN